MQITNIIVLDFLVKCLYRVTRIDLRRILVIILGLTVDPERGMIGITSGADQDVKDVRSGHRFPLFRTATARPARRMRMKTLRRRPGRRFRGPNSKALNPINLKP